MLERRYLVLEDGTYYEGYKWDLMIYLWEKSYLTRR